MFVLLLLVVSAMSGCNRRSSVPAEPSAPASETPAVAVTESADAAPSPPAAADTATNIPGETSTPEPPGTLDPVAPPTAIDISIRSDESAPAPAPVGTVTYYESSVTLPTYPYERYQSDAVDPETGWPFKAFDRERFLADNPQPEPRRYRTLILENAYLKLTILPDLGGRLWQVLHKESGNRMFYQNEVVKPSPWGPGEQLGWLALGGLEWALPVIEHGYEWGTAWGVLPLQHSDELATITVFTPAADRPLNASIAISLRAGAASFEIEPTLSNRSGEDLDFDYWQTALLAPGPGSSPSAELHFVLPNTEMETHSTGDPRLPAPGEIFSWPLYNGRDVSRLGTWNEYAGFFEYPAAQGPFVGVYDRQYDAGAVRTFPAGVARGSKVFALGWNSALGSENYTDNGSIYVELHGGLSPTFLEPYHLPAGGSVTWREVWYPVQSIGDLVFANEAAAINVQAVEEGWRAGFYPTRPMDGTLSVHMGEQELASAAIQASPDAPFRGLIVAPAQLVDPARENEIQIRFEDSAGRAILEYDLP